MKTVEEIYTKKELHQHILDRPDSYIGSTKETTEERFVYDTENKKIIKKIIEYNPGMIKIFDEIQCIEFFLFIYFDFILS